MTLVSRSTLIAWIGIMTGFLHAGAQVDYLHTDLSGGSIHSSIPKGDTFSIRVRPILEDRFPDMPFEPPNHHMMRRYLLEAVDSVPQVFSDVKYFVARSLACLTCAYRQADSLPISVRVVAYNYQPDERDGHKDNYPQPLTEELKSKYRWNMMRYRRHLLREMDYLRFFVLGTY